ncbi:hypothetical protein DMN91_012770 [Ooceraea biroi]|uniref:Mos1 transposase HTH domain-containing protein n=1 Tax=Ooceraea biroi TaxID=2015173 RepID=A0A3L8D4E6_OOCBI|nr:hypothetical protein DMN91_012770 [Ooceraea biroi]
MNSPDATRKRGSQARDDEARSLVAPTPPTPRSEQFAPQEDYGYFSYVGSCYQGSGPWMRTMEKSKIRVIYEYEFRRGTTVSETARNINAVFGEGSTTKATVGNWFKNFRDGDFSLANEPRGRPKTKVDNDHLRAVVESDPSQSTRELASIFNVSIPTILVHLAAIDTLKLRPYIKRNEACTTSAPAPTISTLTLQRADYFSAPITRVQTVW